MTEGWYADDMPAALAVRPMWRGQSKRCRCFRSVGQAPHRFHERPSRPGHCSRRDPDCSKGMSRRWRPSVTRAGRNRPLWPGCCTESLRSRADYWSKSRTSSPCCAGRCSCTLTGPTPYSRSLRSGPTTCSMHMLNAQSTRIEPCAACSMQSQKKASKHHESYALATTHYHSPVEVEPRRVVVTDDAVRRTA